MFINLQLAKKYHPDTNKSSSAAAKFQEISEAYEVRRDKHNLLAPVKVTQVNGTVVVIEHVCQSSIGSFVMQLHPLFRSKYQGSNCIEM